eukprot:m.131917 g.131917  ORF g.131917 m.131917 type:complete len:94 (+) comp38054_c0_seq12:119-400(+)
MDGSDKSNGIQQHKVEIPAASDLLEKSVCVYLPHPRTKMVQWLKFTPTKSDETNGVAKDHQLAYTTEYHIEIPTQPSAVTEGPLSYWRQHEAL